MNRVKFRFNGLPEDKEKYYQYDLLIGTSQVIYRGKAFKIKTANFLELDITSILNNYQYRGYGILTPIWREENYMQPQETIYTITDSTPEQHYNTITVKLYDNNSLVSSVNKNIYFHTVPFEGERKEKIINGKNYYFGNLIPRMPITDKLRYGQLVYSKDYITTKWNNINLGTTKGSRIYNVAIPRQDLYDGKTKILKVDTDCLAPYYLCWITSDGGFQCQPFKGKSTYNETSTTNYKLSYDEQKDIVNRVINGQWELNSGHLTEAEYKEFMNINRSPYLLLYISEYDKAIYVNTTEAKKELKTEENSEYKPLFYTVNIETRENILNIN